MNAASSPSRRRRSPGASKLEWAVFALAALLGCVGIGLEYYALQGYRRRQVAEVDRLAKLQAVAERKERAQRRLDSPLGREVLIREFGGLKPGELPLPLPPDEPLAGKPPR